MGVTDTYIKAQMLSLMYNSVQLSGRGPVWPNPELHAETSPMNDRWSQNPERDKKSKEIKTKTACAQTHTSSNKGKTLESKTQSICSVEEEWSHMFLISSLAEQGEVMMKSSLSSGQVQIHWAVCVLNGFRLTSTHMISLFLWGATQKNK